MTKPYEEKLSYYVNEFDDAKDSLLEQVTRMVERCHGHSGFSTIEIKFDVEDKGSREISVTANY